MSTAAEPAAGFTDVEAAHTLWYFGAGGVEPGSFTHQLIAAISSADPANRWRLGLGVPGYVTAVRLAQDHEGGIAILRAVAGRLAGPHPATDPDIPPSPGPSELRRGQEPMTVRQLARWLLEQPDMPVVMAKDAQGNGHSPAAGAWQAMYVAETPWSGEVYPTPEDIKASPDLNPDEDGPPGGAMRVVVLGPTN
jgi:hypothetical protein